MIHIFNLVCGGLMTSDLQLQRTLVRCRLAPVETRGRKYRHTPLLIRAESNLFSPCLAFETIISHPQVVQYLQIYLQLKGSLGYFIKSNHMF